MLVPEAVAGVEENLGLKGQGSNGSIRGGEVGR